MISKLAAISIALISALSIATSVRADVHVNVFYLDSGNLFWSDTYDSGAAINNISLPTTQGAIIRVTTDNPLSDGGWHGWDAQRLGRVIAPYRRALE